MAPKMFFPLPMSVSSSRSVPLLMKARLAARFSLRILVSGFSLFPSMLAMTFPLSFSICASYPTAKFSPFCTNCFSLSLARVPSVSEIRVSLSPALRDGFSMLIRLTVVPLASAPVFPLPSMVPLVCRTVSPLLMLPARMLMVSKLATCLTEVVATFRASRFRVLPLKRPSEPLGFLLTFPL